MIFNTSNISLPISEIFPSIEDTLQNENTLIIHAPPGAGKSTTVPLLLLNSEWLGNKKIIMLEPRRLAAKTIAMRMAALLGEPVGETVGYRIRFENKISRQTKIEVVTEGILTRMLQTDNSLEEVACVLFDEFHERSIHADLALALCREAQTILRPELRVVIMSATLNIQELTQLLKATVVSSKGRQYKVDTYYGTGVDVRMVAEIAANAVMKAVEKHKGDCLVFLPGQSEILNCTSILKKALPDFAIHPLYGMLSQSKQFKAIIPDREGRRKIVVATSIAETSLTIEGVRIVVDSGLGRTAIYDQKSELMRLETTQISQDSADQRAGRAGRLSEGVCYRLWTLADHHNRKRHSVPEILEADLSTLALELAQWGIENVNDLAWLNVPPQSKMGKAHSILESIGALNNGKITEHGRSIQMLPCHPRIAHMLLCAKEEGLSSLACDIAALLEERDPMANQEVGIDINIRVETLRKQRHNRRLDTTFLRIEKISNQYRKMLSIGEDNKPFDPYETGLLLCYAYPERIACAKPGNNSQFQMSNGKIAMFGHKDSLAYESWIAVAHVDARDGIGKIFLASPLNPKDLAPMVKEKEVIQWRTKEGGLQATIDKRIGSIILHRKPLQNPNPEVIAEAICSAMKKEGEMALNFNSNVEQWQNRVMSLRKWRPEENWPDVSTYVLLQTAQNWLAPYVGNIRKADDLKRLDLVQILNSSLSWDKQEQLNIHAPEKIQVLSGSNIKLEYSEHGEPPILAVRIQEVFGLTETPTVNSGNMPVKLHLLSPAHRPVQITSDLNSFWNGTYHEIRKELKIRYPKHIWPEDPWNEPAVKGIRRKK